MALDYLLLETTGKVLQEDGTSGILLESSVVEPRPIRINTSQGWADIGDATSFVSGSGAPTAAVGATGAIYLDVASGLRYGPKAGGAWPGTPIAYPASTPADATTSAKGIVQLAGDLAGTAASPQIAAGVIVDTDVNAANKDGVAATPSMRTLGTGAQQAAAGNDSRFLPTVVNGQWLKGSAGAAVWAPITPTDIGTAPRARVYRTAAASIPNGTFVAVGFDAEASDTDNMHDTATNNSRLTCRTAGVYLIKATLVWDQGGGGTLRIAYVRLAGTTYLDEQRIAPVTSASPTVQQVVSIFPLAPNDFVEAVVYQDTPGNLSLLQQDASSVYTTFEMTRIGTA